MSENNQAQKRAHTDRFASRSLPKRERARHYIHRATELNLCSGSRI